MIQFENAVKRYDELILGELKKININCWIAGGSVRDYFSGVPINTDHDIFFPNETEFIRARMHFEMNGAELKWESENGIKFVYKEKTFDLIKKYFDSPIDTIHEFDFTVSMFAVDYNDVYYGESSFIDLAKKQLMINKITYPESTLSRAFRYYKKGFTMCAGEMKKMIDSLRQPNAKTDELKSDENNFSSSFTQFFSGID